MTSEKTARKNKQMSDGHDDKSGNDLITYSFTLNLCKISPNGIILNRFH